MARTSQKAHVLVLRGLSSLDFNKLTREVAGQKVLHVVEGEEVQKTKEQEAADATLLVTEALSSGSLRSFRLAIETRLQGLKPFQIERCAIKYVQSTLKLVADSIARHGFEDDQISLSLHELDHASGRAKISGQLQYIAPLLAQQPATRLINVDFRGNEGKLSRVSFNPLYTQALVSLLAQMTDSTVAGSKPVPLDDADHHIDVNLEAARSFVRKTRASLEAEPDPESKYAKSLLRNLLISQKLLERVLDADNSPYLQERWSESDSGRIYGRELSLQRVPARVREAFIGRCHKYDFMASSYALMAGLAKAYEPALLTGDIEHYVKHRALIRKQVAEQTGIPIEKAKAIFTALGFGAELDNNRHKAIRRMLYPDQYRKLLFNEHFCRLQDCMEKVREIIVRHFDPKRPFLGFMYSEEPPGVTGKMRNKNQMLAWIYQRMESEALYRFVMYARERNHKEVLTAHDCVYFRSPLPAHVQADIAYLLRKDFPFLRFEHEAVTPIHADDDTTSWTVPGNHRAPRREFAEQQELLAARHPDELPLDAYLDHLTRAINPNFGRDVALGKSIQL